jgi:hypothetical protein
MRNEYKTMVGGSVFLLIVAVIYLFWSHESTGSALLIFGMCAYGLIGGYLYLQWRRRKGIGRPEDREDATQADGAGEVGFFPAASMWPAGMGVGAVFMGVAMIYGSWYWLIGGVLMFGAIAGFVVESEAREEGPDDPGSEHATTGVPATTVESRTADLD